ncbi:hypothetical protein RI129_005187 [Pyrocoelia pectoralis]|uniref:C2H2-type domain-containing protein n=1 Tax=Pyrocoelia pectoralis TaxID=417401 RepID=A0AAN7VJ96_9COLE
MIDDYQWHFDYTRLVRDTGFAFHIHRSQPTVRNNLEHIDIARVIQQQDIELIDKNINTVLEFHFDNEQNSGLDTNYVKIFRISQLAVQYLLFCKKYLDNTVAYLKKEVAAAKLQINSLHSYAEQLQLDAVSAKNEIKQLQATLSCQVASTQNIPLFQCNQCSKAFSTEEYLLAHTQRRHENLVNSTSFQVETDKLQSEIKALKERLNNTEKYIHNDDDRLKSKVIENITTKSNTPENTILSELQHKFELLKIHVDNELRILQTQKFDQDKYEQWFETFLSKLDEKRSQPADGGGDSICRFCQKKDANDVVVIPAKVMGSHDSTTQTDFAAISDNVSNLGQRCYSNNQPSQSPLHQNGYFSDRELQPHFEKLGEMIHECVTGSMEKIESQVQTFCDKLINSKEVPTPSLPLSYNHKTEVELAKPYYKLDDGANKPSVSSDSEVKTLHNANIVPSAKENMIEISPRDISNVANSKEVTNNAEETNVKVPKPRKKWNISSQMTPSNLSIGITSHKSSAIENFSTNSSIEEKITEYKGRNTNQVSDNGTDTVETDHNNTVIVPIVPKVEKKIIDSVIDAKEKGIVSKIIADNHISESGTETIETDRSDNVFKPKRATIPTLDRRSLRSHKRVALTPAAQNDLLKEVENLLNKQLIELGVSPEWSTIPNDSYERVLKIILHQGNLIKKRYPGFKKINEEILKKVDNQVSEQRNKQKKDEIKQPKPVPKMYDSTSDTDTDDTLTKRKKLVWGKENALDQTQKKYYNVIQEFHKKSKQNLSPEIQIKSPIKDMVDNTKTEQAKSALKNYPSNGSLHKKRVIFNLGTSEGFLPDKVVHLKANEGGSTSSIGSSVFDGSKTNLVDNTSKKHEAWDVSDADISDILK